MSRMFTTSGPKGITGAGRGISMAEGSAGPAKSPHGSTGVGWAVGVALAGGGGVDVSVGGSGRKGVGVTVASGACVTRMPGEAAPVNPTGRLQPDAARAMTKRMGRRIVLHMV